MPSILIVDDLISIHEMLDAVIQPTGLATAFATDGEKALARYKAEKYDLVLADVDMKPMDGLTMLRQLKLYDPTVVVIIMTAYASTESAIQALKFGAFDYLQKPFKVDELISTLKRGLEFRRIALEREAQAGAVGAVKAGDFAARFPGDSEVIKRLQAQLRKLANASTPVLVSGEMGTGHEIVAELLHSAVPPETRPFVSVDCRQSSVADMQSGLIGTGGLGGKWVQQAAGGTLYLGNLQCLSQEAQEQLVSVIRHHALKFRLICATEVDLEKLTEAGEFNEELFYRIATVPVQLPPLRDHLADLPQMIKDIAARSTNPRFDARLVEFTEDALITLQAYRWPGNSAEFTQFISQIIATVDARVVTSAQLPLRVHNLQDWPNLADFLAGQQQQYVARVLAACQGDKARAAEVLDVDPATLD